MRHQRSAGRFNPPLRGVSFALVVCSLFAVGLLVFGRAEAYVFDRMRQFIENATGPLYEFVGPPVAAARNIVTNAFRIFTVYGENERLREENARLKTWQGNALALEQQVASYEALLSLPVNPDIAYRTGRVVDDPGGPFVRTLRINLGADDGVVEGQAVVGPDGLVGRLVGRAQTSSRVLLISDLNSRVPVKIEPRVLPRGAPATPAAQAQAHELHEAPPEGLLVGENDAAPIIDFIHDPLAGRVAVVRPGDRVVTSGKDGVFPPDIPIGTVESVEGDTAKIKPATNFGRLSYVRVLEFESPFTTIPPGKGPPVLNPEGAQLSETAPASGGHVQ